METTCSHRLLITPERWARLRALPAHPLLQRAAATVAEMAESYAADRAIVLDETGHNWHLVRARHLQNRVVTLLVQYGITGEQRFRAAALEYLRDMAAWEYWSWIMWREGNNDPNAIFDLSYGENATTLALAYDWLRAELTDAERALLLDTARRRALEPYLVRNGTPGEEQWYYRAKDCNWNTVCNGGAGMLALALGDDFPESARVLALVEEGVRHYFEFLQEDGAWPEGIGYWGYGHRYGYMYLLSHERTTGRPHPLLARPGSRNTLRFPFLFSPNNVPAGFGDANAFFPLPFIYLAAERFDMPEVIEELDRRMNTPNTGDEAWPNTAELLLAHPGETPAVAQSPWPRLSVQKGIEWGYIADAWPHPSLYVSVRGGTTRAPHTHQDLTSLYVLVGKEPLIVNIGNDDYIDTTFSERRYELYENSAAAKNVMLISGVGLPHPGTVATSEIHGDNWRGILLDATAAASVGSPVHLYHRAVLMLADTAILVIERAQIAHAALGEVRYHTRAKTRSGKSDAVITGNSAALRLTFTANVPCLLNTGQGLPTLATRKPEHILRWMTTGKHTDLVFATLMTPNGPGRLTLDAVARTLHASGDGFAVTLEYATL